MSKPQKIIDYSQLELKGMAETYLEKRIENDGSGNPLYIGYNRTPNASTTALSWFIVKISYTATFPVRYQLPNAGPQYKYAWDSRTTYFT